MYEYSTIAKYIGLTPYLLVICLTTSLFNLWPCGLNNVAPMFLLESPTEFHVRQNWTENLIETGCSATYTNMFNMTQKQIHWAGIPNKEQEETNNGTVVVKKSWDQCKGVLESDSIVRSVLDILPSGANFTQKSCQKIFDDVTRAMADTSATDAANAVGHGYWWGEFKSGMVKTVRTDFEIVCDNDWMKALSTSIYMAGFAVGAVVFGNMSDIKGRKSVMRITSLTALLLEVAIVFSPNFWVFTGLRFGVACCLSGCYVATFTYAMEVMPKDPALCRTLAGVNVQMQFAFGYIFLGFLSLIPLLHDWRYFQAAIAAFGVLSVTFSFYVPESPAWLFAQGRDDEALAICDDIHFRKTGEDAIPDHILDAAQTESDAKPAASSSSKTYTMADLFHSKEMTMITINVMYQWLINTMTYYGLVMGAGDLPGSVVFNNSIGGALELASALVVMVFMNFSWCGRKRLLIALEFIAASTCTACAVLYFEPVRASLIGGGMTGDDIDFIIQSCAMVGKFGIAGSFTLIYNYTAELYPVVVKSNGVAIGSFSGRIGGILFPQVLSLNNIGGEGASKYIPMGIFGVTALVCTFCSFFLPETMNSPELKTLEDADAFYKGQSNSKEDENENFIKY